MQVKMILRKPFLYDKYRNAKFEYFEHLDLCKFDPQTDLNFDEGLKEIHKSLSKYPDEVKRDISEELDIPLITPQLLLRSKSRNAIPLRINQDWTGGEVSNTIDKTPRRNIHFQK
mmetsp:Transcript_27823/g.24616  ORF Transcript_27823/g.24616 Transcript_27823/m.24616 type:complete len:115 (+) Transcript_27823:1048-1392(+)